MLKLILFFSGGIGYGLLEILWRGCTHPSMLLAGGICTVLLYDISKAYKTVSPIKKALLASLTITMVEITVGLVVNICMGLEVWDYSGMKYNLCGQISLLYSTLWFFLGGAVVTVFDFFSAAAGKKD